MWPLLARERPNHPEVALRHDKSLPLRVADGVEVGVDNFWPQLTKTLFAFLGLNPSTELPGVLWRQAIQEALDDVLNKAIPGVRALLVELLVYRPFVPAIRVSFSKSGVFTTFDRK